MHTRSRFICPATLFFLLACRQGVPTTWSRSWLAAVFWGTGSWMGQGRWSACMLQSRPAASRAADELSFSLVQRRTQKLSRARSRQGIERAHGLPRHGSLQRALVRGMTLTCEASSSRIGGQPTRCRWSVGSTRHSCSRLHRACELVHSPLCLCQEMPGTQGLFSVEAGLVCRMA